MTYKKPEGLAQAEATILLNELRLYREREIAEGRTENLNSYFMRRIELLEMLVEYLLEIQACQNKKSYCQD